jgi:hypothetical protein
MNELIILPPSSALPTLVAAAGERAGMRFLEFFAANKLARPSRVERFRAADPTIRSWCWVRCSIISPRH